MLKKTAIVSNHTPQRISDCCCRFSRNCGRRCHASASIPNIANGKSHTIWPPRGSLKRRNRPGLPVLNIPPLPPPPPPLPPLPPFPNPCGGPPLPPVPAGGKPPGNVPVPPP